MPPARHVLLVDDDPDVSRGVAFMLTQAGYTIHTAHDQAEAHRQLQQHPIHAAILDIRLEGHDEGDDSGLRLAAELPPDVPRIIYTGHANPDYIKRALEEKGRIRAAHRFVAKGEAGAADELLVVLEELFRERVAINFDLEIHGSLTLPDFARRLYLPEPDSDEAVARDIEEILRRLFHPKNPGDPVVRHVTLTSFLSTSSVSSPARNSALVLRAQPQFGDGGLGRAQVIKLGPRADIEAEAKHHRAFVERLSTNCYAQLEDEAYARRVGGLRYAFIGAADLAQVVLFGEYYRAHEADDIAHCLHRFFSLTYRHILQAKEQAAQYDLRRDYADALHLTPDKLKKALNDLPPEILTQAEIQLPGIEATTILNPVTWAIAGEAFRPFVREKAWLTWGHGDLHSHNLLVDHSGNGWLIDCARADKGHILRDFVELETDIKFSLLPTTDLGQLWIFEAGLLKPMRLSEDPPPLEGNLPKPDLQKAYTAVSGLRALACDLIGLDFDMREYYQALFYQTLNVIRLKLSQRRAVPPAKDHHPLLAAALIAERLEAWPQWPSDRVAQARPERLTRLGKILQRVRRALGAQSNRAE
jgi:CheY-like chemotaxis protein